MKNRVLTHILVILTVLFFICMPVFTEDKLENDLINAIESGNIEEDELQNKIFNLLATGNIDTIKDFSKKGYFNYHTRFGIPPLVWATFIGRKEVVEILLDNEADPNEYNIGYTPLTVAAGGSLGDMWCSEHVTKQDRFEIAKMLIEAGADVNHVNNGYHCYPLHAAAHDLNIEIAKLLIENGADVNIKVKESYYSGYTPLMMVFHGHGSCLEFTKLLIEHGANVNDIAKDGITPLNKAKRLDCHGCINLLVANGANH